MSLLSCSCSPKIFRHMWTPKILTGTIHCIRTFKNNDSKHKTTAPNYIAMQRLNEQNVIGPGYFERTWRFGEATEEQVTLDLDSPAWLAAVSRSPVSWAAPAACAAPPPWPWRGRSACSHRAAPCRSTRSCCSSCSSCRSWSTPRSCRQTAAGDTQTEILHRVIWAHMHWECTIHNEKCIERAILE